MGILPVPGEIYLDDFPDKAPYAISRNGQHVSVYDGLTNTDDGGNHVAFLYGSDIQAGDFISSPDGFSFTVKSTGIDTYEGKPSIVKAHY